jgi:phosphatidylserine/phosphatidylglycerophosphate/cardiolipin synthase-like enzyme
MGQLEPLGNQLLEACRSARSTLTLCAPFVKGPVLKRVLDATAESVSVELFTRWRPEEVAAGVSDTVVLDIAESRGGRVLLCDRVHAKFMRFDDRVLIGSANLTATALGWTALPNLELLIEVPANTAQLRELEDRLRRESIVATPTWPTR